MPPKSQKKKKKKEKKPSMKLKQVFDYTDMPHKFGTEETTLIIAGKYEGCGNDTYHRWYPDRIRDKKIGQYKDFDTEQDWKNAKLLNDWLLQHGMTDEPDTFCFHVLIHASW
jgi:hypothetical protein